MFRSSMVTIHIHLPVLEKREFAVDFAELLKALRATLSL